MTFNDTLYTNCLKSITGNVTIQDFVRWQNNGVLLSKITVLVIGRLAFILIQIINCASEMKTQVVLTKIDYTSYAYNTLYDYSIGPNL